MLAVETSWQLVASLEFSSRKSLRGQLQRRWLLQGLQIRRRLVKMSEVVDVADLCEWVLDLLWRIGMGKMMDLAEVWGK